jgi:signal transduction histidine kinase
MYLHITNAAGEVLFTNLSDACNHCLAQGNKMIETVDCPATASKRRRAFSSSKGGQVYFCDEAHLSKSRRIVKERMRLYTELLSHLDDVRRTLDRDAHKHMKHFMHNLTSQNAHNIQELEYVIPQASMGRTIHEQIGDLESELRTDARNAARALLRINKNNFAMRCEFIAFRHLHGSRGPELSVRSHKLHKVLVNALSLFFQDFREKRINVVVEPSENAVRCDYDCLHVALYHLFSNAAKYAKEETTLAVSFQSIEGRQRIRIDMVSLQITDADMERLFEEGFSGELPRVMKLAGSGVGLGIARDLLRLNDARLEIRRNVDGAAAHSLMLARYENNVFDITFGNSRPRPTDQ